MKSWLSLLLTKPTILVGGQAVIEGVMMRVPGAYATAVRSPEGKITLNRRPFRSRTETSSFWRRPVLRGLISLYEALKMGMQTLQWSADVAQPPAADQAEWKTRMGNVLSTLFALGLAFGLFLFAPYWIATTLLHLGREALLFNLTAGVLRIVFFLVYLVLLSRLQDVRRLFQYHGAEHKVVFNFESGRPLTVATAQQFTTFHPRCGTSFLFIVLLSSILFFALADTLFIYALGPLSLGLRLALHLPLIPVVAGLSYEIIRLSARPGAGRAWRWLRNPGLWLQRITTRPPEDEMVEVAITALKSAFGPDYERMVGQEYVAEAIG